MKIFRRIFKLFLPAWYMHRRLDKKFGIKVSSVSESRGIRFIVSILPYYFSAILQQRKPTDRRVYKYFLPYGKMCDHIHAAYAKNVRNPQKDIGIWGKIRSCFPYGLILWWDNEDKRLASVSIKPSPSAKPAAKPSPAPSSNPIMMSEMRNMRNDMTRMLQNMRMMQDRMEILSLRTLLGGKFPSASVVLTGRGDLNDLIATIGRLSNSSLMQLEIIIAADMPIATVNENINLRPGVSIEYVEATGLSLSEVYNLALKKATGDYIGFLEVGDYYSTDDMLEYLMLRALNERVQVYGGSVAVSWKNPRVGLSSVIFDRKWLISLGLEVCFNVRNNDGIFIRCAKALADHSVILQRSVVNHVPLKYEINYTEQERKEDILNTLLNVSRAVKKVKGKEVLTQEVEKIIKDNIDVIRNLVWLRGVIQKDKADIAKELASNIEKPELAEDILNPLVSVIVPAYNVEKYLSRCIESLVMQTLSSIEIIVVDDGSSDSTPEIADEYSRNFPQVKVVHRKNGGRSAARNSGMNIALGKYIGFVDGDDYVDTEMFRQMSNLLEKDDVADLSVCGAKVEFLYKVDEKTAMYAQKYFDLAIEGGVNLSPSAIYDQNSSVCTKLYRRDFLQNNNIRFPEGMDNEDEVFYFFTMGKAKRAQIINKPFYHYLRNDKGIMAVQSQKYGDSNELPDSLMKAFPLILEYLKLDDRRDLMGVFFRHICGTASRYDSDYARKRISQLLHASDFFYYHEFLDTRDLGYVDNILRMCHNYDFSDMPPLNVDKRMLPKLRLRFDRLENPVFTFIVPVYNQERYLAFCLESLKRQTEQNIEVICVDDGSTDNTWSLLEKYAAIDGRIRIFHQENKGVSAARNLALNNAKGRYIAFVDGDDYVELTMAEEVSKKMDCDRLDVCMIDLACFDYKTRKSIPYYWTLKNHRSLLPNKSVFTLDDIEKAIRFVAGVSGSVWSRDFIERNALRFENLINCEDLMYSLNGWIRAKRMGIVGKEFYHYRRGNPASAVSKKASNDGDKTVIDSLIAMAKFWQDIKQHYNKHTIELIAERLLIELVYYGNNRPEILAFLQEKGFDLFDFRKENFYSFVPHVWVQYEQLLSKPLVQSETNTCNSPNPIQKFPSSIQQIVRRIEESRKTAKKDLYIITGQLNSTQNEPLDSWSFFMWLQEHNIPSRYVMWKKHKNYAAMRDAGQLKDVILLEGNACDDYEFIEKCEEELIRCKVVAQENGALNYWVRYWLYYLPDCQYAFLEHGIKFWKCTDSLGRYFSTFNTINNSSQFEVELLNRNLAEHYESGIKPKCIVGGLPRLDLLSDKRVKGANKHYVFVMFTWRSTFNGGQDVLEKSAYYHALRALLRDENIKRLEALGVEIVLSAHHHLVNKVKNLSFGESVKIVSQDDIAYWKSHADLCLTDYSSISFDFMYLNKPVIYWIPDRYDLILNNDDYIEIMDAQNRGKYVFNVANSLHDVIALIENYARKGFSIEPEKQDVVNKFFKHRKDISRHLYEEFEKI